MADPTPNFSSLPEVQQLQSEINTQEGQLSAQRTALTQEAEASSAAINKKSDAIEGELSAASNDIASLPTPQLSQKPTAPTEPPIDSKDFQKFSYSLIAMALIGGAASKGNWLGVSATLNGALKGYMEGNQQAFDQRWKEYEAKFNEALAHDKDVISQYEAVLNNKKLSINEILQRANLIAVEQRQEDIRQQAEIKSIDGLERQVLDRKATLATLESGYDRTSMTIKGAKDRAELMQGPGLSEAGRNLIKQDVVAGDKSLASFVMSRYGQKNGIPIINELAAEGVTGGEISEAAVERAADMSAMRATRVREVAVQRLTGAVQSMQSKILTLAKQVGLSDVAMFNTPINAIRQKIGDEKFQQLRTELAAVARQYIEAVTMPGSNAQLHASSQEMADSIINSNMTLGQLRGAFAGMNDEIKSGRDALGTSMQGLREAIEHNGLQSAPEGQQGGSWQERAGSSGSTPKPAAGGAISLEDYARQQGVH